MTGSPVRTTVINGMVACGVMLAGAGGLGAAIAVADPGAGAPGHSAGPGPEVPGDGQPHPTGDSPDAHPAKDPTAGADEDTPGGDGPPPAQVAARHGSYPRTPDVTDAEPGAGRRRDQSANPADMPDSEEAGTTSPIDDGQTPDQGDAPDPAGAAAFGHHGDGQGEDDDDDCGWPPHDTFWTWLFHLFTPQPGTTSPPGVGGRQGGGPALPSVRIPASPPWPDSSSGLPPEIDELPERVGDPAEEPPAAAPALPPAAVIPAPVEVPAPAAPPSSNNPAIAVPATPNSTQTQHPPQRPEVPATSPTVPGVVPDGFRAGYATYLRSASIGEVAGLAVLGVSGLAALTALGGLIGFRQAKAGLAVRAAGTARFLK